MAHACSGRGPLAVPPGLMRAACSQPDTALCQTSRGTIADEAHKKTLARQGRELLAVPPWLTLPCGASTLGAGIVRHSVVSYCAALAYPETGSRSRVRFASAARGRAQAACRTGLTPAPGSLTDAATVLVPVFAFTMHLCCGAVYATPGLTVKSRRVQKCPLSFCSTWGRGLKSNAVSNSMRRQDAGARWASAGGGRSLGGGVGVRWGAGRRRVPGRGG